MLDNFSVAVMSKVNELANCYGVKPFDFVATISSSDHYNMKLRFESPPSGDEQVQESFLRMLADIGLPPEVHEIVGSEERVYSAIENALHIAPKPRIR